MAFEPIASGHKGGVWSAESHWDAEALGRAHANVSTQFSGRGEQRQTKKISCSNDQGAVRVGVCDQRSIVMNRSAGIRILNQDTKKCGGPINRSMISDHDLNSYGLSTRLNHCNSFRMT